MRIIAGHLKGRRLAPVKGRTRPTGAKVREAIFNILGEAVAGVRVLDLFAGTGALGLEALSRGAQEAVFVEDHPAALAALRRNLEELAVRSQARVLALPVRTALKKLSRGRERFGLVFLDPPYDQGLLAPALQALVTAGVLAPGAWVAAEMSSREEAPVLPGALSLVETRRYGDTQVAFYRSRENDN
ncbi:MAG: 16S rRNA (guanine(966)-N(2))-methyltransferase RsmD [Deltaproteobacteria bacterium]|nr:16S rRNA (guanine(966)-N(2))-methyltransferase RsmD [Deltaproteobacteria bacterium]